MYRSAAFFLLSIAAIAQPRALQIHCDRLKPSADSEYTKIEEDAARTCARLKCPNPYLAIRALNGPDEVWILNFYDSDAEIARVARAYEPLASEMGRIAERKKNLVLAPEDLLAYLQDDISAGAANLLTGARFISFTTTTFDPDHLKYSDLTIRGWVFRLVSDASMLVVTPSRELPGSADPKTRLFMIVPGMSFPAPAWIEADPQFWKR
jgi:hypothetical protein